MQKALVCEFSINLSNNTSKLKARLHLPQIDETQRRAYEADFRQKMAFLALFLLGQADGGRVVPRVTRAVTFAVGINRVVFTYGSNVTTNGQPSGGAIMTKKIKAFFEAYCVIYNFKWYIDGEIHTPANTNREAAFAMWSVTTPAVLRL